LRADYHFHQLLIPQDASPAEKKGLALLNDVIRGVDLTDHATMLWATEPVVPTASLMEHISSLQAFQHHLEETNAMWQRKIQELIDYQWALHAQIITAQKRTLQRRKQIGLFRRQTIQNLQQAVVQFCPNGEDVANGAMNS
jgi:hypothetical protein